MLLEIFQHLRGHELAESALVCRSWLATALATLYRHISFNTVTGSRAAQLETTLRRSPHICALIRHLQITHTDESRNHLLSWIGQIPENSLLSLHLVRMPISTVATFLFQFPAIRTVLQITIMRSSFLNAQPSNFMAMLSFPRLEGLSLLVSGQLPLHFDGSLRLQRLSLGVLEESRSQLLAVILGAIMPNSLRKLNLYLPNLEDSDVAWLTELLRPHLSELRHFTITRTPKLTRSTDFIDDIVELAPHLESLVCGRRTYTSRLFSLLPSTLRSLTLESGDNDSFPRDELEESISRLCNIPRRRFESLTIGCHPNPLNQPYFERVLRVCKSFGVSFAIRRGSIGKHLELRGSYPTLGTNSNA